MIEVAVTKTWTDAQLGEMSHVQRQRWSFATDVYCPDCAALSVWVEETHYYEEDNVGDCYICHDCGHSFHYDGNYINEAEAAQILAALPVVRGGKVAGR